MNARTATRAGPGSPGKFGNETPAQNDRFAAAMRSSFALFALLLLLPFSFSSSVSITQTVTRSDTFSTTFAWSVSLTANGSLLAVGADFSGFPATQGAAYVYNTATLEEVRINRSDASEYSFGHRVALSGDGRRLAVSLEFSTYLYVYDTATWTEHRLDSPTTARLGSELAWTYDASLLAVGVLEDDSVAFSAGAVYLYNMTTMNVSTVLTTPQTKERDYLGTAVAMTPSGEIIVAGAYGDDEGGDTAGAAYVFNTSATGNATRLTASDAAAGDEFGSTVAVSSDGSLVAVGAPEKDDRQGYVYLYRGLQETRVGSSDGNRVDYFGSALALSGDGRVLVVGAYDTFYGTVYLFDTDTLVETKIDGSSHNSYLGRALAISTDSAFIAAGAPGAELVRLYDFTCPLSAGFYLTGSLNCNSCPTGSYCPDGTDNKYACAPGTYNPVTEATNSSFCLTCPAGSYCPEGSSNPTACAKGFYCPLGRDSPLPCPRNSYQNRTDATAIGDCVSCPLGTKNYGRGVSLASCVSCTSAAGDCYALGERIEAYDESSTEALFGAAVVVLADGRIAVGAPSVSSIYLLDSTTLDQTRITSSGGFGSALAVAGDLLAVGAPEASSSAGRVHLINSTTWSETTVEASDASSNSKFGSSVSLSSNLAWLAVGAPLCDSNGCAYVVNLQTLAETKVVASDGADSDDFGTSIELTSDGSMVIVGAPHHDGAGPVAGAVYLYELPGLAETKLLPSGTADNNYFGQSLSLVGNMLAVGSFGDQSHDQALYLGGAASIIDLSTMDRVKVFPHDAESSDYYGYDVALSPDGSLLAVGAREDDDPDVQYRSVGSVFLYRTSTWELIQFEHFEDEADDHLGAALAWSPDGRTLLAGAPRESLFGNFYGSVYRWSLACPALAGFYLDTETDVECSGCPMGAYCLAGQEVRTPCSPGTFNNVTRSADGGACKACSAGSYCPLETGVPIPCAVGHYCPNGEDHIPCPPSTYNNETSSAAVDECSECPAGTVNAGGAIEATSCVACAADAAECTSLYRTISADDSASRSLALSGDGSLLLVGIPANNTALLFDTDKLTSRAVAPRRAPATNDFGRTVAISDDGSTLAVSAPEFVLRGLRIGAVYVHRDSLVTPYARITADDGDHEDSFGRSLDMASDGSFLLVGAIDAVYWVNLDTLAQVKLTADAGEDFGYSVALSLDSQTIAVGAPEANSNTGRVLLFNVAALHVAGVPVTDSDGQPGSAFGRSISLSAGLLAVGAPGNVSAFGSGRALLFSVSGTSVIDSSPVAPVAAELSIAFGTSVSLSADSALLAVSDSGSNVRLYNTSSQVEVKLAAWSGEFAGSLTMSNNASQLAVDGTYVVSLRCYHESGFVLDGISGQCRPCPAGEYCPAGQATSVHCPAGTVNTATGATDASACLACSARTYCPEGSSSELECGAGSYCPTPASRLSCPSNTYQNTTDAIDLDACVPCPSGTFNRGRGTSIASCEACPAGSDCFRMDTPVDASERLDADAAFGFAVSQSSNGSLVAIGSPGANGDTGVVVLVDSATMSETNVTASDASAGMRFGKAVALSPDASFLAVGAEDAVYVYTLTTMGERKISGSGGFGHALGLTNLALAVGAPDTDAGAGTVFVYDTTNMSSYRKVEALSRSPLDEFGSSVALTEEVLAVGAPGGDDQGSSSGTVHVFNLSNPAWPETVVTASDGHVDLLFGSAVALASDSSHLAVGAPGNVSAYVYSLPSLEESRFVPAGEETASTFGASVSLSSSGELLVVGAPETSGPGSAYLFNTQTRAVSQLLAPSGLAGDLLGHSVQISADEAQVVSGAYGRSSGKGGAYLLSCPRQSYLDWDSGTCLACPTSTSGTGPGFGTAASCEACRPGTYANTTGLAECTECPAGRFGSETGASTFVTCNGVCPAGSFSYPGSSGCTVCPAGTAPDLAIAANFTYPCVACPAGSFRLEDADTECIACSSTSIAPVAGRTTTCEECAPGFTSIDSGGTLCEPCDAGWHRGVNATECTKCDFGTISASPGQGECTDCPAGRTALIEGSSECTDCGFGKYRVEGGPAVCVRCASDRYTGREAQGSGPGFCRECPVNSVPTQDQAFCECNTGYYDAFIDPIVPDCVECTEAMLCDKPGMIAPLLAPAPGYWRQVVGGRVTLNFVRCDNEEACAVSASATNGTASDILLLVARQRWGTAAEEWLANWTSTATEAELRRDNIFSMLNSICGLNDDGEILLGSCPMSLYECETGYEGKLCSVCADGYYRFGDNECAECGSSGATLAYAIPAVFGVLAFVLTTVWVAKGKESSSDNSSDMEELVARCLKNNVLYATVVSQLAVTYDVTLPGQVTGVFDALKIVTFDVFQAVPIECAGDFSYYDNLVTTLVLPFAVSVMVIVAYFVARVVVRGGAHLASFHRDRAVQVVVLVLFLLYPNMVATIIKVWHVRSVDGEESLVADVRLKTDDDDYTTYSLLAGIGVLTHIIGIPAVALYGIRKEVTARENAGEQVARSGMVRDSSTALRLAGKARAALQEQEERGELKGRFRILYSDFRSDMWAWEFVDTAYKLALTVVAVFVLQGSLSQLYMAQFLIALYTTLVVFVRPFGSMTSSSDDVSTRALVITAITQLSMYMAVSSALMLQGGTPEEDGYDVDAFGNGLAVIAIFTLVAPWVYVTWMVGLDRGWWVRRSTSSARVHAVPVKPKMQVRVDMASGSRRSVEDVDMEHMPLPSPGPADSPAIPPGLREGQEE